MWVISGEQSYLYVPKCCTGVGYFVGPQGPRVQNGKILREVWKSNFCADELEDRLCCCLSAAAIPRVSVRPGHLKNQEDPKAAGNGQFEQENNGLYRSTCSFQNSRGIKKISLEYGKASSEPLFQVLDLFAFGFRSHIRKILNVMLLGLRYAKWVRRLGFLHNYSIPYC